MSQQDLERWADPKTRTPNCTCIWCDGAFWTRKYPDGYVADKPFGVSNVTLYTAQCQKSTGAAVRGLSGQVIEHVTDIALPTHINQSTISTGHRCTHCNEFNEYAAANQANGTYLCYRCRV